MLLRAGAKINLETTLAVASRYGDLQIVTILLEMGSKVNGPDMRALKQAEEEWEHKIESKLAEYPDFAYHSEKREARSRIEDNMWRNVSVESPMYTSIRAYQSILEPPIIAAARGGHSEIASLLLERGADPNILRVDPETGDPEEYALGVAARRGNLDVIRVLLDHGAFVDGPTQVLPRTGKPNHFAFVSSFSRHSIQVPHSWKL